MEGTRLYQKNIWEYENAAAKALAEILAHNDLGEVFLPETLAVLVRLAESLGVTVDRLLAGNQETDKTAFYLEIQELLGDCSTRERAILTEIAYAAKRSIREHKLSRPP